MADQEVTLQNNDASLPPLVLPISSARIGHVLRQTSVALFFKEYRRILGESITRDKPLLAHVMALSDEKELLKLYGVDVEHYKIKARGALLALRRRKCSAYLGLGKRKDGDDNDIHQSLAALNARKLREEKELDMAAVRAFTLSEDQIIDLGYPAWETLWSKLQSPQDSVKPRNMPELTTEVFRDCDRCHRKYVETPDGAFACTYHWGRLQSRKAQVTDRIGNKSQGQPNSTGCAFGPHVHKNDCVAHLHALLPFEVTIQQHPDGMQPYYPLIALDCEMCYTSLGFELCRISAVDQYGDVVLDELVRPQGKVIDLNSRWSGIKDLSGAKYTLPEVRAQLFAMIDQRTIMVGHSLEGDLKVMRAIHPTIADTSIIFPHPKGLPYRFALRTLVATHLKRFVQQGSNGHDSLEDAQSCLALLRHRLNRPDL